MDIRTGIGYDMHRLVEGRDLYLGGVKIPFEKGLLGHSDADVLIHAICDALLGAANMGDIGRLFPDTDAKYKDMASDVFLKEVVARLDQAGYRISNVDSVIICQQPKISPHYANIQASLAGIMGINPDRVSVKASTSEGLGPTGQQLGIEARASALIIRG